MNILYHKLRADLLEHKTRSLLAIVNIAVGLFAVGVLFGMVDMQLPAMDRAHRAALPSQVNLILARPVDARLVERLRQLPGVGGVEAANLLTVRYQTDADPRWQLATLVGRADFAAQQFDRLQAVDGPWPAAGQLGIERLTAQALQLKPGATLRFETPSGERRFTLGGVIRHPFVKPPAFGGQAYFFADADTLQAFGVAPGQFRQLLLRVAGDYDADRARQLAETVRGWLGQQGIGVAAVLLQDPAQHWGRAFVAGINQILQLMALLSLGLGALLTLNTVAAQISQQTAQIGVMKALGGGRFSIAKVYLLQVLLLGLAAIALALPASLYGAWAVTRWLLNLFNIGFDEFQFSARALGWLLAGGVLAPLLAALGPIGLGVSRPVRQNFGEQGVGGGFGGNRFDRAVERLAGWALPTLYASAACNLLRRKGRLLLTQLGLIAAGVAFLLVMSLSASLNRTLDGELARTAYSVKLGLAQDQPLAPLAAAVQTVPGQFEYWLRSPMALAFNEQGLRYVGGLGAQAVGLPPASRSYQPLIVSGRWLNANDAEQNVLVLNAETAELNGIQLGDRLSLAAPGQAAAEWQVIGLYRWIAGGGYAVEAVYTPLPALQRASGKTAVASQLLAQADIATPAAETAYRERLQTALENAGIKLDFYSTTARLEQRRELASQFRPVLSMLFGLALMLACVGGIGLSGALSIGVMQRRREIGVLRAIGAPNRAVFGWFIWEGILQAIMAWAFSIPLAFILAKPLATQLGLTMLHVALDYQFNWLAVWVWLAVVILIALLAAYMPARSATRVTVRDAVNRQ